MILIIIVCTPLLAAYLWGVYRHQPLTDKDMAFFASLGMSLAFIMLGVGHFFLDQTIAEMLPPFVPYRLMIVYITGVIEIIIGIGLMIPSYRVFAGIAAISALILFLPANIYAALNSVGVGGHQDGPSYLWFRIPLQGFLIAWAYYFVVVKARLAMDQHP